MSNSQIGRPRSATIHVLQVTPRFWPDSGGIETHVHEVSRRLVEQDVDVTVLTTDPSHTYADSESTSWGYEIKRVKAYPRGRDYLIAPRLWRLVTRTPCDLVHFQGVHTFVPVLGMLAALLARKRYLLTLHTGGNSSQLRTRLRHLQWRAIGPLLRRAEMVIGVSRYEADLFTRLARLNPRRVRVIRNGGTAPRLAPAPIVSPGPLLVSVGRLERYKGHHRVIESLPRILEKLPDSRLLILGRGPYEDSLKAIARQSGVADRVMIEFIAGGNREELLRRLSQAQVGLMLSDYEAHPVAVMECLSIGLPVVITANSGLAELAEEGWCRAVPAAATPDDVAAAVFAQLEAPVRPSSPDVLPTWEQCVRELLSTYDHLCGKLRVSRQ